MFLSVIVPAYNEEKTIKKVLERLSILDKIKSIKYEIIVVDDHSSDKTTEIVKSFGKGRKKISLVTKNINNGKGSAVREGLSKAKGDYVLIQDADLEYHPNDIPKLLNPVLEKKAEIVFGTRLKRMPNFNKDEKSLSFFMHYLGNKFLSLITSLLFGVWVTDMETGYKLFPKQALKKFKLNSSGFDFEPELTAKLLKNKYKYSEVQISTNPRSSNEGKKLVAYVDGPIALFSLIKYRFVD